MKRPAREPFEVEASELHEELRSVRAMLGEALDGAAQLLAQERGLCRALEDIRLADQAPAEQLRLIAVRALEALDVEQAAHRRPVRPPEPCDGNRGGQDTKP